MVPSSVKKILILSIVGLVLLVCCAAYIVHLSQSSANSFAEGRKFKDDEVTGLESGEQLGESSMQEKEEFQLEARDDQGDIVFDYRIGGGSPDSCIVYAKGILKSIDPETGIITLSLTQEQVIDKVDSTEITLKCAGVHYKNGEVKLTQFLIGDNVVAEFGWPQNDAIPRCGFLRKL